ncbi:helix-turn-helix transcriptional regulator [Hymenobacter rubidus]|uniref:helix-turn-helix transcriptional regulator n=1 Tax=Hymenobacter rubidus TaxID=1441626 RepID=UPI00191E8253|nr:LuxR C-terminal-related transcriptional regulator [Hymenobacter rubidus]
MIVSTPAALVAAPPTLFRQGLLALLREQWPQLQLTLTADATQVPDLVARHTFELIVFDGALPGLALPALLDRLHRLRPTQRLLVLADPRTLAQRSDALTWPGTQLLLPSHVPPHALAAALAPWLDAPPKEAPVPSRLNPPYTIQNGFSRRELEVLRLVVADCCNEEIANRLFINVRTVESHRRNLLQKAGTRTLVGLAARAVREGWVA